MSTDSDRQLREALDLFAELLEMPAAARAERLATVAKDAPRLAATVDALLARDTGSQEILASGPSGGLEVEPAVLPRVVGRFALLERLGQGGSGVVYRARPTHGEPRHDVAVKLLRIADPELVARFDAEQRILGGLEHPNVARLLACGATEDGFPWVAMELVDGEPITAWAEGRRLDVRARVELLRKVLDAVDYAHSRLIVHRDLKPANVLVTARGEPKLLDFGIAKELETGQDATVGVAFTPGYASPEQLRGERATPAADVYALGIVLCELVSGSRPPRRRGATPAQLATEIAAAPPVSIRALFAASPHGEALAAARDSRPRPLLRLLGGDLEAIVQTATHPDPARRYRSAAAFDADLERWLHDLPVTARPESRARRVVRALRRHRVAIAVAGASLAAVLAIGGYSRSLALARDRVAANRERAEAITRQLLMTLSAADPWQRQGGELTARVLLDEAAKHAAALDGAPDLRAAVLGHLGVLETSVGSAERAIELLEQARAAIADEETGLDLGESLVHAYVGAGKLEPALTLAREVETRRRELGHSADRRLVSTTLLAETLLRNSREEAARYAAAEEVAREGVALADEVRAAAGSVGPVRALGPTFLTAPTLVLAQIRWRRGDYDEAAKLAETAAAELRRAGVTGKSLAEAVNLLGLVELGRGRPAAAAAALAEVTALTRSRGEEHPDVAAALNNLAGAQELAGDLAAAERSFREALAIAERNYPPEHPLVLNVAANLAHLLTWNGDPREGAELYERVRREFRRSLPADHPFLPALDAMLAEAYSRQGRHALAVSTLGDPSRFTGDLSGADLLPTLGAGIAAGVRSAARPEAPSEELAILEAALRRLTELQGEFMMLTRDAAQRLEREQRRARSAP